MPQIRSACCYCGVGCGVMIETDGARIAGVRGDPDHPANFGRLCTKGAALHLTLGQDERLLHPALRGRRVSWDEALDHASQRFSEIIRRHGPDSVAFYISGQLLTEDYYVFNKLAKGLLGTNNVDTNSRLCMSSAVAGYKATLGADAPPACYEDIDRAGCVFIAGSNTAFAHPILYRRLEDARARDPAPRVIVVDPRRTETAAAADLHLAIQPGTDVALFNAMLHVMLDARWINAEYIARHTEGFEALAAVAREMSPADAALLCGLKLEDIVTAARWFATGGPTLSMYCQGLNQSSSGTAKNAALINLHLATGQIGKAGAGPFSLTGQPNAMGGREVGGMANLLSAHRDLGNPAHRAEVARLWGVPAVPEAPGKTAVELFDALHSGEVKAVWIACTNPAQSMPDQRRVREALRRAEFVVLQECYRHTETAEFAHLLLPATTWGEKDGTVTNSERRISRVRAAVLPPGEARHDWQIACDIARRMGGGNLFPYASAEEIFNEHRESTRGRDLDITGLSYRLLDERGPQHWPFPEGARDGRARLYEDGLFPTASGKARFFAARPKEVAEPPDENYPLALTTIRLRDQWHGMSRTGNTARLFGHAPAPMLSMHRDDMRARGLADGDMVAIESRRGAIQLGVCASPEVARGQACVPMHWGSRRMSGAGANALTVRSFDPVSKQPELKHAAIEVRRAHLDCELVLLARDCAGLADRLQPLLERFPAAYLSRFGHEREHVEFRARFCGETDPDLIRQLDAAAACEGGESVEYEDERRGVRKRLVFREGALAAARFCGETAAAGWVRDAMARGDSSEFLRRLALAPIARLPSAKPARGRIVCSCLDVAETEILDAVARGAGVARLQATLRCGTSCGSCVPELRRLAAGQAVTTSGAPA